MHVPSQEYISDNHLTQPELSNSANDDGGTDIRQNIESTIHQATSDLDIDAIIQSFIREQQNKPLGNDVSTYLSTNQYLPSTSSFVENMPIQEHHNSTQNLDPFVNYQDDGFTFSADDMLFGFNSSAFEGIGWEI